MLLSYSTNYTLTTFFHLTTPWSFFFFLCYPATQTKKSDPCKGTFRTTLKNLQTAITLKSKRGQQALIGNASTVKYPVLHIWKDQASAIGKEQFWWTSKVNQRAWVFLSVYNPVCFYLNSTSNNYCRQLIIVVAFNSYLASISCLAADAVRDSLR